MTAQRFNILYVEDDPEDRQQFTDLVERIDGADFYVEPVSSVESALFSLQIRVFDVLVVDFLLRDMDPARGNRLLDLLIGERTRIPVIVTSSASLDGLDARTRALVEQGTLHFLSKADWNPETIHRAISAVVDRPLDVLCVEDDDDDALQLADLLRHAGRYHFNFRHVHSPGEAEAACRDRHFDVFLVDLKLQGEDGLDYAARLVREREDPAVLVMSGVDEKEVRERGLRDSGSIDVGYVSKNEWTAEQLERAIICQRNNLPEHAIPGIRGFRCGS